MARFRLALMIDCGRTGCFRSQDIVTPAYDGEKINYNTIQIDEQLNVSTPQRVVIVHCSLIEVAEVARDAGPSGRQGCALPRLSKHTNNSCRIS